MMILYGTPLLGDNGTLALAYLVVCIESVTPSVSLVLRVPSWTTRVLGWLFVLLVSMLGSITLMIIEPLACNILVRVV